MKALSRLVAVVFALASNTSMAGVIYEWKSLNGELPKNVQLKLEFDEATVSNGTYLANFMPQGTRDAATFYSGLVSFSYDSDSGPGLYYTRANGFPGYGHLKANLQFERGGFLTGSFYFNDMFSEIGMLGSEVVWEIKYTQSDASIIECGEWHGPVSPYVECNARGLIRRANVPEPGSLALLGLGLIAAASIRRRSIK